MAIGEGVGNLGFFGEGGALIKVGHSCAGKSYRFHSSSIIFYFMNDFTSPSQCIFILTLQNENGKHPAIPFCTGLGSDVELTRALLLTIQDLASSDDPLPNNSHRNSQHSKTKEPPSDDDPYLMHVDDMNNFENYSRTGNANFPNDDDDGDLLEETSQLDEMEDLACHVANRAMKLRDGILEMIRVASGASSTSPSLNVSKGSHSVPLLKEKIVQLEGQLRANEERLEEMAKARNEAVASERRVRRGLYRLACGRMKMDDVLKVCFMYFGIMLLIEFWFFDS